ncbi:hypothetical protein [Pseudorhodoplanes sp.]|uniref:hypothetical protein n=1 Tax=Pseudorhodoplanes sp. TaxID=1934341 RepID=UPI002BD6651F|nr:hypothetical protein [Pseudorhodoplanes sp.]HWV54718.1 hypothetical protein [Pseudorhodoplanes sp.]
MVFDESDCDQMERALLRAYRLFMSNGRLCTDNFSIAKATLSRAIMHAMERGERNELRLAMYAVNTFNTYSEDIVVRDMMCLRGQMCSPERHRYHERQRDYAG